MKCGVGFFYKKNLEELVSNPMVDFLEIEKFYLKIGLYHCKQWKDPY